MVAFHLTEVKNLLSIRTLGLLPSRIILNHHLETFNNDGLVGDKIIYCWHDCFKTSKFAKDMIYCKQWIDRRNKKILEDYSKDKEFYLYEECYVLLKIDYSEILNNLFDPGRNYDHAQYSTHKGDSLWEMDSRFEHDDKKLCLFKNRIDFKYIEPVNFYHTKVDKSKKLIIKKIGGYNDTLKKNLGTGKEVKAVFR